MTRLLEHVAPRLDHLVDEFYDRQLTRPGVSEVIARLSPEEFAHLKAR